MIRRCAGIALAAVALVGVGPAQGAAQGRLTQDEALRLAFPDPAVIERHTAFLKPAELEAARAAAGSDADIAQSVVTYYVARQNGTPVGVAYFDGHRVRSQPEVLMVILAPDGRVRQIEVLKFDEPPEYRAPEGWLAQFKGKDLAAGLSLKGGIANMTGATLTSQAIVRASRRVLALHDVIRPFEPGKE